MSKEVEMNRAEETLSWKDAIHKARLRKKKDWTIMVYLGGDNNLAEEMVYSLKSMFSVGSTKDIAIFAFFDAGLDPVRFPVETRDQRRKRVGRRALRLNSSDGPVTEDHSLLEYREALVDATPTEVKSVQSTLEEFLLNSICEEPANHYMLVLSGHGSGSIGDFLGARKRSSGLTISDLGETLRSISECFREASATRVYQKIDILGLDSCQMSTAEVAYQVRNHVKFMIGAEGFEPNTGWPYDRMLDSLKRAVGQAEAICKSSVDAIRGALSKNKKWGLQDGYEAAKEAAAEIFAKLEEGADWQKFEPKTVIGLAERGAVQLVKNETIEQLKSDAKNLKEANESDVLAHALRFAQKMVEDILPKDVLEERYEEIQKILTQLAEDAVLEVFPEKLTEATLGKVIPPDSPSVVFPAPKQLAAGVVRQYTHFYASDYTLADVSTDVAALDLAKMDSLVELLRKGNGLTDLMTLSLKSAHDPKRVYLDEAEPPYEDINDAIVLAHWEAQGYKDEQNVDLWDFCGRLKARCIRIAKRSSRLANDIAAACDAVQSSISDPKRHSLTVLSGYCGPAFQHSHGLSVYFPWCESTDAAGFPDIAHYGTLEFAFGTRWDEFLDAYTEETRREGRLTSGRVHRSTLNRRDGFFMGEPDEGVLSDEADLNVQDGQIIVRDGELVFNESQELVLENDNEITFGGGKDGRLCVREGELTLLKGALNVTESPDSPSPKIIEINVGPGEKLTARDGRLTVDKGRLTVRDGRLSVRDGRLSVRDGRLSVRDGRLSVRDKEVVLRDEEELTVRDGRLSVRGAVLSMMDGRLSVRDGRLSVRSGDITLNDGDRLTVRDGRLSVRGETVRDGRLSVRDGRLSVRDTQLTTRDGRLSVRDGRLTVRDGRLSVRDKELPVQDGEELSVRDGRLSVRGESLTVRDGRLTVRDGRLSVRNASGGDDIIDLNPNEVLTVRDGRLSVRGSEPDVRDGRLSVRDGRLSVRGEEPNVRDGRLSVRDGRLSVRSAGFMVRDGRLSVRGDGQTTVRDGRLSVRDGRLSVRDARLSVRNADVGTVRDGRLSVRGSLGLVIKIASMKNPPTVWLDCDLVAKDL